MKLDCLRYLRSEIRTTDFGEHWDVFVSAFNGSSRVRETFEAVHAATKFWIALPEYNYSEAECPSNSCLRIPPGTDEFALAAKIVDFCGIGASAHQKVCIDITGFMRPHILSVVHYLSDRALDRFYMMYTEPEQYIKKEHTSFSGGDVSAVRQVRGYEGVHDDETGRDVLVVGMGYDDGLVSRVAADKEGARIVRFMSLPSLSADMYQESVLRLDRTGVACSADSDEWLCFAPANDPFAVASELSEVVQRLKARGSLTNLYLCPLATKPQALGFALFYLSELKGSAASVIFPFAGTYERETSAGRGKTWLYEVETASATLPR